MFNIIMSELQEVTTADLEKEIGSENNSIILSEKENDSNFEDDLDENDDVFSGDQDIPIFPSFTDSPMSNNNIFSNTSYQMKKNELFKYLSTNRAYLRR